jgi:hypothetical protein
MCEYVFRSENMTEKVFPKGTEVDEIMDFVKNCIKWKDEDIVDETAASVWIKVICKEKKSDDDAGL